VDCTFPDIETLCCRFVMEEASKFEVAIVDGAMWVSPTDEFGGGGRVKGGGGAKQWDELSKR
jgi:hypothetical protein